MSEKGSYAHVGLPGLKELFAGGGKAMDEGLSEIEIDRIRYDASCKVGGEYEDPDVFLLLDEVGRLRDENKRERERNKNLQAVYDDQRAQLTEKDATIKELQTERDNTAKASWGVVAENVRLRKALEEARSVMEDALSVGEARHKSFDQALCPWCDLIMGVESINKALGEGDKE